MADDIDDAQSDMDEQARWGLNRIDMALVKFLRGGRIMRQRIVTLETRVTALEARVAALGG